jgi:hypothetical protein
MDSPNLHSVARGFGWFSIGLGLAEMLAPGVVGRVVGMAGRDAVVRAYGVREIVNGVGLLTARNPAPWMWSRVAGDALDAATVGTEAGRSPRAQVSMAVLAAVAAADLACAAALSRQSSEPSHDYSNRSGLPQAPDAMRGAARADFEMPGDMQLPSALKPYTLH